MIETFERIGLLDMVRGPKGEYRPNDPMAATAVVARIATGQSDEATEATRAIAVAKRSKSTLTKKPSVRLKTTER